MHYIGALELFTANHVAWASLARCSTRSRRWPSWRACSHQGRAVAQTQLRTEQDRVARPRGGNIRLHIFAQAVDQALWDLQARSLGCRSTACWSGKRNKARAYSSGLEFHLTSLRRLRRDRAATRLDVASSRSATPT